tara:strand:- start:756 stop:1133 length:378 start_codon:yes stop_codon:yes gene_type:complete
LSFVKEFFNFKIHLSVINGMHSSKDLRLLLRSLQREAIDEGFELVIEPSDAQDLFIIANAVNKRAAVVGLTEINDQKIIVSYSISLMRYRYYKDEGFNSEQMSNMPIKNDIFDFIPVDKLINYLK